jgi:preprotein translocase subunit Sec61beta
MPQDNKLSMPSGMGGLMRYFDEYKSKTRIKPGHIIITCFVDIMIMVFLYTYGNRMLGI